MRHHGAYALTPKASPSSLGDQGDSPEASLVLSPIPSSVGRFSKPALRGQHSTFSFPSAKKKVASRVSLFRSGKPAYSYLFPLLILAFIHSLRAAEPPDYDKAFTAFQTGHYEEALAAAEQATQEYSADKRWWRIRLECLATLGRYREGSEAVKTGLRRYYSDGPIRVIGYELLRLNNAPQEAQTLLSELIRIASYASWQFRPAEDRVWVGRAAVLMGVDARQVLEQFYDHARKLDPDLREVYLAMGELSLLKYDNKLAAETYRTALKKFPDDPEVLYGLARALQADARKECLATVEKTLERNPRHLPSLLLLADDALAHEDYKLARASLDKVLAINPHHARAWAHRAVLAHLQNDSFEEQLCRDCALSGWSENPEVDFLIGSKLSSAYRFTPGAAYQRAALKLDPNFLPARTQLTQDLLRLGEAEEGWKMVEEVRQADAYNVVIYNLATLHDHLTNYTTLETPHFLLHMEKREAAVYGPRVLALLERARATLGKKYGYESNRRVTVEILNDQRDFAIRTFGLPGGDGILGVCFGQVITANSPAALKGHTTNWEATLWHEYCHVVTLDMTEHRIPRWLSEGISVFEERQANPTWGNRLTQQIRRMVLSDQLTPVSQLNQAFRTPKSPAHFNLAYYEASLVVQFLVEKLGHETLRKVLSDVTHGMPINASLELRTGSLSAFEKAFDDYARKVAQAYGEKLDWTDPDDLPPLPEGSSSAVVEWLKANPRHYRGRLHLAQTLIEEKKWKEAQQTLESLVKDAPQWNGDESPYTLLADVHREQKDTVAERRVLEASAAQADAALQTYRRLIELASASLDHADIAKQVNRYLAVQPLDEFPYKHLAESGEHGGDVQLAVGAARSLLALEPADQAGAHFQLAKLLHVMKDPEAKRQVLMALEETPRFRDAQRLLLKIVEPAAKDSGTSNATSATTPTTKEAKP